MRVVIDTNVLVRLVVSRGGLLKLKFAVNRGMVLITSDYLLAELEATLNEEFGATRQRAKTTTRAVRKLATVVVPEKISKLSRDPKNDPVLAAAVVGKAEFLVSDDGDLSTIDNIDQFKIINYRQFLDKYTKLLAWTPRCIYSAGGASAMKSASCLGAGRGQDLKKLDHRN